MARERDDVDSKIEQVTVYANGARVRRVAKLLAGRSPLPTVVRFAGLPVTVTDDTVRAEVDGAAVVTALRTGVDAGELAAAAAEEPQALRAARKRVALAQVEHERVAAALARLAEASIAVDDPSDEPPAAWSAIVAARRALVALRAERELALRDALAAARREVDDARRALEVEVEREQKQSTARAAKLHELRKYIELDLSAQPGASDITIRIEYVVPAARWAPSYVARLDGDGAKLEMRAIVAQDSGEDWTGVALRLSTAEPDRFSQLPELQPQKIGKRQHEPAKRGFREPPLGADQLYGDYDRGFPKKRKPQPFTTTPGDESTFEGYAPPAGAAFPRAQSAIETENWDEESSAARAFEPMPTPQPAKLAPMKKRGGGVMNAIGGMAGAAADAVAAPMLAAKTLRSSAPPPAPGADRADVAASLGASATPTPRLDYGSLRMAPPSSQDRGKLVAAPPSSYDAEVASRIAQASSRIAELVLPRGYDNEWAHTYDYAFESEGKVDVIADATWHSIALTTRTGTAKLRHVSVPREQADVFRIAELVNPFHGPLLPGPIDVYDRGQFLVTSDVDYTPPGAPVHIGLGVDPTLKIARNVEFREEATGMLRGQLRLMHAVTIEVENLSQRAVELEVRERVPVTREGDDDIEVTVGKVDPAWERWTPDPHAPKDERLRGGYRWKLSLAAGKKQLLRTGYEIKIVGKLELVGGNRREP